MDTSEAEPKRHRHRLHRREEPRVVRGARRARCAQRGLRGLPAARIKDAKLSRERERAGEQPSNLGTCQHDQRGVHVLIIQPRGDRRMQQRHLVPRSLVDGAIGHR